MSRRLDDAGAAAAEFAVAVPAVVVVLLLAIGMLNASGTQVRLEQAAAHAARLVARGEDPARAAGVVTKLVGGASLTLHEDGDFVCAAVSAPHALPLPLPVLQATSCALAGGL